MCRENDRCRRWFDREQFAWIHARSRKRRYVSAVMLPICNIARAAVIRLCAAYYRRFQSAHFWKVVIPRSTQLAIAAAALPPARMQRAVLHASLWSERQPLTDLQNTHKMEELCQNCFTLHRRRSVCSQFAKFVDEYAYRISQ